MRIQLAAVIILLPFSSGCSEGVSARADTDNRLTASSVVVEQLPSLRCTIRSEPTCELGNVPDVKVAITNQTNADIYLVGSLDGSFCKWRYPHCYFEVTDPGGEPVFPSGKGCGFMNALRKEDFVKVPPGGTFDPYQHIDDHGFFDSCLLTTSTFRRVGVYRIRFVYSTDSDNFAAWLGTAGETVAINKELVRMFRQVPKVEIWSNEIKISIIKRGK